MQPDDAHNAWSDQQQNQDSLNQWPSYLIKYNACQHKDHWQNKECLPEIIVHGWARSEEHTSELQSQSNLVCRLLLEKKKKTSTLYLLPAQRFRSSRKTH